MPDDSVHHATYLMPLCGLIVAMHVHIGTTVFTPELRAEHWSVISSEWHDASFNRSLRVAFRTRCAKTFHFTVDVVVVDARVDHFDP
jgi:hypothetical protein